MLPTAIHPAKLMKLVQVRDRRDYASGCQAVAAARRSGSAVVGIAGSMNWEVDPGDFLKFENPDPRGIKCF